MEVPRSVEIFFSFLCSVRGMVIVVSLTIFSSALIRLSGVNYFFRSGDNYFSRSTTTTALT